VTIRIVRPVGSGLIAPAPPGPGVYSETISDTVGVVSTLSSSVVAEGGPEILFASGWETATGTSLAARTDGDLWAPAATSAGCDVTTVDLRVVASGDAPGTWPSGIGNIMTARNSTAGCGGVEAFEVFPPPETGMLWGIRYYYCQDEDQIYGHNHGLGDLNAVGNIDIVFHHIESAGSGSWRPGLFAGVGSTGGGTSGTAEGDDGGRNFNWIARVSPESSTSIVLPPNEVTRHEMILEWTAVSGSYHTWRYRLYPRIYNAAGDLLADQHSYRHNDGGYTLAEFYAAGSTFLRNDSAGGTAGEENHIRSAYFGIGQSKSTSTGRMYWGRPVFYLPSSTSDFIGGI